MSVGRVFSRVFTASQLACSHCGSTEIYPFPGLFGELGGFLGRVRYACRDCREHTWLRPDAPVPSGEPEEPEPELELEPSRPPQAMASLDALDIDSAPLPRPCPDLRALDEVIARGRRKPSKKP
jgi:hypothetical protein